MKELCDSSAVRLTLGLFRAGFARSDVQREVREIERASDAQVQMMKFAPSSRLEAQPDCTQRMYVWGSKRGHEHINTEPMAFGCLRALTAPGSVIRLVMVNFSYIKKWMEHWDKESGKPAEALEPVTMTRVRKYLGAMSAGEADALRENDVRL